jgi:tripartite-type tricarboxylate transporter receptor subunit TctC
VAYHGRAARTGARRDIVQKIATELSAIAKEPDTIRQFDIAGIEAVGTGPEDFEQALREETERFRAAVRTAGIQPD